MRSHYPQSRPVWQKILRGRKIVAERPVPGKRRAKSKNPYCGGARFNAPASWTAVVPYRFSLAHQNRPHFQITLAQFNYFRGRISMTERPAATTPLLEGGCHVPCTLSPTRRKRQTASITGGFKATSQRLSPSPGGRGIKGEGEHAAISKRPQYFWNCSQPHHLVKQNAIPPLIRLR